MQDALQVYTPEIIQTYLAPRAGEQKLGNTIQCAARASWQASLEDSTAKYVLVGIPEDIGIRANGGVGGAESSWVPFLKAFLNIQDNEFLSGSDLFLLGHVDLSSLLKKYQHETAPEPLRQATTEIDALVYPIIQTIVSCGKIPIIIGGGHNNAYPILKGSSLAKKAAINAINMDAHADFRELEGRHSGNGFHYAYQEQYLKQYAAFGLHEGYNNATIWQHFQTNKDLFYTSFEQMYLRSELSFEAALAQNLSHVQKDYYGVELDLDCIADTLSSAVSPLGFSRTEALRYLYLAGQHTHVAYVHLTEGVFTRADGMQYPLTGKLLSYLVQAFVKGNKDIKPQ
ncbi:arginase [Taibaiella sp. KBW10]|uniref:arginase family protein n=1 Tax=Taibaiella sp. KBW10 TaxID=2153357 RepID=UPI000F593895|nr:arginase family protein [Taibaiella sp. KBW10]RQO30849.1 arginase [Taibaiella sp. KBW10]